MSQDDSGAAQPLVPSATRVELELVVLQAGERAPGIPADTAVPFAARVRGFLDVDALRRAYLGRIADARPARPLTEEEARFLADDTGVSGDELGALWDDVARRPGVKARG